MALDPEHSRDCSVSRRVYIFPVHVRCTCLCLTAGAEVSQKNGLGPRMMPHILVLVHTVCCVSLELPGYHARLTCSRVLFTWKFFKRPVRFDGLYMSWFVGLE